MRCISALLVCAAIMKYPSIYKEQELRLGMATHAYKPRTWEVEVRELGIWGQSRLHSKTYTHSHTPDKSIQTIKTSPQKETSQELISGEAGGPKQRSWQTPCELRAAFCFVNGLRCRNDRVEGWHCLHTEKGQREESLRVHSRTQNSGVALGKRKVWYM